VTLADRNGLDDMIYYELARLSHSIMYPINALLYTTYLLDAAEGLHLGLDNTTIRFTQPNGRIKPIFFVMVNCEPKSKNHLQDSAHIYVNLISRSHNSDYRDLRYETAQCRADGYEK
jgi:hypothetical protein